MKASGIRFCRVSEDADKLAGFPGDDFGLEAVGDDLDAPVAGSTFRGAVFTAGTIWVEARRLAGW